MTGSGDTGYAITVQLPGRYCWLTLYATVPAGVADSDGAARASAQTQLATLAEYVPAAKFSITNVRRLG